MGSSHRSLVICLAVAGCGGTKGVAAPNIAPLVTTASSVSVAEPPAELAPAHVTRTLLERRDVPGAPGIESRIYLMTFPPGAASPPHVHTMQGAGYVLDGAFESAFDDEPATIKRAGDAFIDVPGKTHHFKNVNPDRPLRFVFSGTFPKGAPIFRSPNAVVRFSGAGEARTAVGGWPWAIGRRHCV